MVLFTNPNPIRKINFKCCFYKKIKRENMFGFYFFKFNVKKQNHYFQILQRKIEDEE